MKIDNHTGIHLYALCVKIAKKAHQGQYRKDGKTPYFKHCSDVGALFHEWQDKCVAILHDSIEDGACNGVNYRYISDQFTEAGVSMKISNFILRGLNALTHHREQTYKEYVEEIPKEYRKFKIADITCNLADSPSDYQKEKYKKVMKILLT